MPVNLVQASCVDVMDDEESTLDEATIRRFLETGYPKLVAGLAMVSGSRPLAEDAIQEALARAWERSRRGQTIERLEAWVTTVALNLIRSRFRRAGAERRARDRLVPGATRSPSGDRVDLHRALRALPRRQREVTVLHYYLDFGVTEVAALLGVSTGTVKTSLHRARRALAAALGEREDEEEANRHVPR